VAGIDVRHLGDFIREQRDLNNISLRQLARLAGVSNPYLSQIERGLRKPSAEILQQIAKALRISAEALYVQAGFLEQREGSGLVADAVLADDGLSERQKQVLLEIYDSFRKENAAAAPTGQDDVAVSVVTATTGLPDGLSTAGDGAAEPAPAQRSRAAASTSGGTAGTRSPRPRRTRSAAPQPDAPDADQTGPRPA
jgi:transcriptional regulator with XRE-family HTH domain